MSNLQNDAIIEGYYERYLDLKQYLTPAERMEFLEHLSIFEIDVIDKMLDKWEKQFDFWLEDIVASDWNWSQR